MEPTVDELKIRWLVHKERLKDSDLARPTLIRFHRACSWLRLAESSDGDTDPDCSLIYNWIAFNALYGQWDATERQPAPDAGALSHFTRRELEIDQAGHVATTLQENRELVMSLLEDPFITRYFWRDPTLPAAAKHSKEKFDARTWYFERRWLKILDRVLTRIYFTRCQLIHGAATYGSYYNRDSVRNCAAMMGRLVLAFLQVIVDFGADEDWGPLCYPPLK